MTHNDETLVKLLREGWRGDTATDLMREAAGRISALLNGVTVADAEALVDLLHGLNEQGADPSVAFLDAQGRTGVAYGIDGGDEMYTAYFSDPGDDRWREEGGVQELERDIAELRGPIQVLHEPSEGES